MQFYFFQISHTIACQLTILFLLLNFKIPFKSFCSCCFFSDLLLRRRSELFCLLCCNSCRHVQGQHELIVAELLVVLQFGDKVVWKGHNGLNTVLQLAVAEIMKQLAHLGNRWRKGTQFLETKWFFSTGLFSFTIKTLVKHADALDHLHYLIQNRQFNIKMT